MIKYKFEEIIVQIKLNRVIIRILKVTKTVKISAVFGDFELTFALKVGDIVIRASVRCRAWIVKAVV